MQRSRKRVFWLENPTAIRIDGSVYPLNTDFRAWIKFERLLADQILADDVKFQHALDLTFYDEQPHFSQDSFTGLLGFYACGKRLADHETPRSSETQEALYDYEIDGQRIKATFLSTFNMNPWAMPYFHWWDFRACFEHMLGMTFENVIRARTIDLSDFKGEQLIKMREIKNANSLFPKKAQKQVEAEKAEKLALSKAFKNGTLAQYLRDINAKGDELDDEL